MYFLSVLKSNYCKSVFLITFVLSYFLIPDTVFNGWYYLVAVTFMTTFSLTIMCIVRSVKERLVLAKTYGGSLMTIIATAIGLSALQVCGVGAPICGASIGLGVVSAIFPGFMVEFLESYAVWIIIFSALIQVVGLYYMNCFFRKAKCKHS